MIEFSVDYIAQLLDGEVRGNGSTKINTLGKIEDATDGAISFLANPKYEPAIYTTQASAVLVDKRFEPRKPLDTTLVCVNDPYLGFTTLLEEYYKLASHQKSGTESPVYAAESATVGSDVYQGAFSYVGEQCQIGAHVKLYPHAYVGDNVTIGDYTIIHSGVKIYPGTVIGSHCVIHAGTTIGSDGFGFAPQEDGTYKTIPQIGNVVIGHHVNIGSNTVIDCATMGSTEIGDGVKLDNLIQIAHNVTIGEHTVIAAQTGISGSTRVGKHCVLAGQVGVIGHLTLADRTTIGAQAGVGKSTREGDVELGSPSFDRKAYLRTYAAFKRLPDLVERIRALEEKVAKFGAK